jgi:hypothetical protein
MFMDSLAKAAGPEAQGPVSGGAASATDTPAAHGNPNEAEAGDQQGPGCRFGHDRGAARALDRQFWRRRTRPKADRRHRGTGLRSRIRFDDDRSGFKPGFTAGQRPSLRGATGTTDTTVSTVVAVAAIAAGAFTGSIAAAAAGATAATGADANPAGAICTDATFGQAAIDRATVAAASGSSW